MEKETSNSSVRAKINKIKNGQVSNIDQMDQENRMDVDHKQHD